MCVRTRMSAFAFACHMQVAGKAMIQYTADGNAVTAGASAGPPGGEKYLFRYKLLKIYIKKWK